MGEKYSLFQRLLEMRKRAIPPKESVGAKICGCLSRCCSLNCSVCYFVFSLWGFIMLLILGSLLSSNYEPIHLNELNATEASQAATGSYAAAGIYAGFMVLCAVRFAYIMFQRKKETQNQAYQRVN